MLSDEPWNILLLSWTLWGPVFVYLSNSLNSQQSTGTGFFHNIALSGGWASWFTEVYCIMFITQLVYISSPLHLNLKDHCTNWRTLNKGSGQNLWPFKFFISIFVVLVLLFSLTFYNFHGQNYLNALKISIYGTVNNDELAWSSVPQLSEKVFIHPG